MNQIKTNFVENFQQKNHFLMRLICFIFEQKEKNATLFFFNLKEVDILQKSN